MFRDPEAPESSVLFLANWELEVRAGFTPAEELDVVLRLQEDYLNPDEPPELETRLIAEATVASEWRRSSFSAPLTNRRASGRA